VPSFLKWIKFRGIKNAYPALMDGSFWGIEGVAILNPEQVSGVCTSLPIPLKKRTWPGKRRLSGYYR
jgi:hypothetical protein